MARAAPTLLLALSCLLLLKLVTAQPRPMCAPQFALANRACAIMAVGEDSPSNVSLAARQDGDVGDDKHERQNEHDHRHGHDHHGRDSDHDSHHHDHDHHHDSDETRATRDCCRWLKEVDPTCVCESLIRLPAFLIRPKHTYTISIGDACKFEYNCGRA